MLDIVIKSVRVCEHVVHVMFVAPPWSTETSQEGTNSLEYIYLLRFPFCEAFYFCYDSWNGQAIPIQLETVQSKRSKAGE